MAEPTKNSHVHGGTFVSDIKSLFSAMKTRRTITFAYIFMFAFVGFTVFLAFSPSQNAYSLTNMFSDGTKTSNYSSNLTSMTSDGSYRSQFSTIVSHLFPNSSEKPYFGNSNDVNNGTEKGLVNGTESFSAQKGSQRYSFPDRGNKDESKGKNLVSSKNSTVKFPRNDPFSVQKGFRENNFSEFSSAVYNSSSVVKNESSSVMGNLDGNQSRNRNGSFQKRVDNASNQTVWVPREMGGRSHPGVVSTNDEIDDWMKSLMNCDLYDGRWVLDNSYPLYKPGSCSFIDEQFNCIRNGRPDSDYQKYKWKPKGCKLPRMNGTHLLELIKGKRLVFVGDSLNRNMWESLICILKNSVKDPKKVHEAHGKVNFRGEAMYSFVFKDYRCSVEFFVAPFLVREWEMPDKNGSKKETLRLDLVGRSSYMYKDADFIVFNTGHWWTHEKTSKGLDYYQEGDHVYTELNVLEAFRKALTTWGRWVDAYVNPKNSIVFFRGYSVSHFSGGQWNSGGACDNETEPITNDSYIKPYPPKMMVLESVLKRMKTHVTYLNITQLTDYRKDGHPSIYRRLKVSDKEKRDPLKYQDCSHWCLPGVPDAWNELLYTELLVRLYQKQHSRRP